MLRTFVTNRLRQPGMSPEEVPLLEGQEDIQTTLKIHAQVSDEDVITKA